MEGASRRHKRDFDLVITGAWHTEAFARMKRLDKLSTYLADKPKPIKAKTPDEMFAVLQAMAMGGAPLTIREVN